MKILVIHEFKVTLKIVRNYLMTECEQVGEVSLCPSPDQALDLLTREKFDLVFSGLEMADISGLAIHERMLETEVNRQTPFVILTSNASEEQYRKLAARGVQHVLPMPFTPDKLRAVIAQAFNPRQHRAYRRYSIPDTRGRLTFGNDVFDVRVLNISLNGLLCELDYDAAQVNLLDLANLSVIFPSDYPQPEVQNILVSPVRIEIQACDSEGRPRHLRTAWRFLDCPQSGAQILSEVFKKADMEMMALKK